MSPRSLHLRARPTLTVGSAHHDAADHAAALPTSIRTRSAPRLILASNRLPVTVTVSGQHVEIASSSGGLATGLRGVHARSRGLWIGWSGAPAGLHPTTQSTVDSLLREAGCAGVPLSRADVESYYERFANGLLWPALHDLPAPTPDEYPAWSDWEAYRAVNARFAAAIARHAQPGDQVWIHDYHLLLLPGLVRERCPGVRIGFFLHTPFPTLSTLATLPGARALVSGLLGADVVAFHTAEYAARFTDAVATLLQGSTTADRVSVDARTVSVRTCPMSIDFEAFAARSLDGAVLHEVERLQRPGSSLLVGVDRLDYTKGIPERLRAFDHLLASRADMRGRVRLLQVAVPSREQVPAYRALRTQVEGEVARINTRFGTESWTPIEYVHGGVDPVTLSALYRAADVMLVTPHRDGMNLVAKEFVATRTDGDGVLVLSERAGAAAELRAALLVDPTDVPGMASALHAALTMPRTERRVRMRRLRARVRAHDVYHWARLLLQEIGVDAARLELHAVEG